jgi:hypothetical protein
MSSRPMDVSSILRWVGCEQAENRHSSTTFSMQQFCFEVDFVGYIRLNVSLQPAGEADDDYICPVR